MTRDKWMQDEKALARADQFYQFIGEYVISFQWIELKIDQMFHVSDGQKEREKRLSWLARQRVSDKVKKFRFLVLSNVTFNTASLNGWNEKFEIILDQIESECLRRNSLLHSNYIFDFLAIGAPIIQNRLEKSSDDKSGFQINNFQLSEEKQRQILEELAILSVNFSFCCTQLIHLYKGKKQTTVG